jgi:hypothetical protein
LPAAHRTSSTDRNLARQQQVRARDLRIRFPHRPTSLVLDDATLDFTLAGILDRRQLASLRVNSGLLVLDTFLRNELSATGAGTPQAGKTWSLGVLDIGQLGIRLADLGARIPTSRS